MGPGLGLGFEEGRAMDAVAPGQYKLSCQLIGHEDDVRGLCVCGESMIATASRDRTVRVWYHDDPTHQFKLAKTFRGHTSFVGPVAWIPPNEGMVNGGLVSGGIDTNVIIWDLDSSEPAAVLQGHELQVTSVVVDQQGDIYSASVDSTIKRWRGKAVSDTLRGHKGPVQAVTVLPDGNLVTGSSDTTIKLWKGTRCSKTIDAHTDTVRGLALMPNVGFLSASHDGTVRLWSPAGEPLLEMVGHTAIVYSVAAHSSGDVASGSEDGHAKIWRGGVCSQNLEHPGCVWDLQFMPNGDLVTACSDGIARVWTLDPSRYASTEEVAAYEASVLARQNQKKTVGGVKLSELPGFDSLQQPGSVDGQTRVVREGDTAVAYSWNMKEYNWDKVGEVVEGPDDALSNKTINGVTYDYVFDVDIGDGQPTRKLPYNRGDNPYDVADRWLLSEDLPMAYRQQIVDFILQNTGQQQTIAPLANQFFDPYTGANAYVPTQQLSGYGGRTTPSPTYRLKHIPRTGILMFDTAQYDGIFKKLSEFNVILGNQGGKALTQDELNRVQEMLTVLKDTSHYHASRFPDGSFDIFIKKLFLWPVENIFPVLDLLRLMLLHPQAASYFSQQEDILMDLLKTASTSPAPPANIFLSGRAIVNCFRHECLRKFLISHRSEILDRYSESRSSTNRNIRSAYAHMVLNYAVRLIEAKDEDGQIQVLSAALEMAGSQEGDTDIRFLTLQAIGSLIHSGLVKQVAIDLDIRSVVDDAKKSSVAKVAEIGGDLDYLLK